MSESLWIFGYGSLVWRPAFAHRTRRPAYVEGFARRFWQGSTDHRGLPERPGRVVTLVADAEMPEHEPGFSPVRCWGTAYEVPSDDPEGVLRALDHRERGGYERWELEVVVSGADGGGGPGEAGVRVPGLVYVAPKANPNYLGPAPLDAIAVQVAGAAGPSGTNPEYVFELAASLRRIPAEDPHVFALADAVEAALARRGEEESG